MSGTESIERLEKECLQSSDILTAVICQIAINGSPRPDSLNSLDDEDRVRLNKRFAHFEGHEDGDWNQPAAIGECAEIIDRCHRFDRSNSVRS